MTTTSQQTETPGGHLPDLGYALDSSQPLDELPRSVPGLHDVILVATPDGGLAHPDLPDVALTADRLAAHARPGCTAGSHLRLLVDDGARHGRLLGRVADLLGCDILVAPVGASVGLLPAPGGRPGDAVVVDRTTGTVVDWTLVQPASLATPLPGWFDLVGGLVLPRTGLATLPLPEGIEFVDRASFVRRRAAAARLATGHPDLVTVAVTSGDGGFRLPRYDADDLAVAASYDGPDLAAALSGFELYGGDVRLWMRWPDDPTRQRQLTTALAAFVETTGATVWAPAPGGEAVLLPGCRDLGVRDRSGNVTRWQEYRPPYARSTPRFTTDLDGRLMPAAGPAAGRLGAATMVSNQPQSGTAPLSRYAGLTPEPGIAMLDLSLLDDGRLAMYQADGSRLAVGGRALRALLVDLGWTGEDLQLLMPVPAQVTDGLHTHLAALEDDLRVEWWSLPPGASVAVRDGLARAVDDRQQPATWRRTGRSGPVPGAGRWHSVDGRLVPVRPGTVPPTRPAPAPPPATPTATAPPPDRPLPAPSPYRVAAARHRGVAPGVPWVTEHPATNTDPVRLWLSCPWPPGRAAVEGVPTADLFLVGDLDGARVARASPDPYLLCLRVDPGHAIDLYQVDGVPDEVRRRHGDDDLAGRFLLPAAWLDHVRLLAGYRLAADRRPGDRVELPAEPVSLRCTGAGHGVDGLPEETVRWPGAGQIRQTGQIGQAWVLLPETPQRPDGDCLHGWLQPPPVRAGHRLARVRLDAGAAIDVPATAAALVGLVPVRSQLPDLLVSGVDLILPAASYDQVRVDQVRYADGDRWRPRTRNVDLILSTLFTPAPDAAAHPTR